MRFEKIAALGCAIALAGTLAGCSGGGKQDTESGGESSAAQQQTKEFDGSAYSDTGAGTMYIATPGGTSEGGNVPEIAASGSSMMQIEVDTDGMDGSVCTVYVDGVENTTMNAGERTQQTITLEGSALSQGVHIVELVKMDGDTPAIYKKAEYKVA